MWGTLIDYWHYTGDGTYNQETMTAMLFQTGDGNDYMPSNVTLSLGNDDQGFWGMSAMLAAEVNFPNPPSDKPQWLALAQAVFETQASPDRHDTTCGGGLRWQIPVTNAGYDYKNSIANGCLFNLGARLARYTGNMTYAKVATDTYNWVESVGFIAKLSDGYHIYDGAHVEDNCTDINKVEYSYNNAVYVQGAAFMYNITTGSEQARWKTEIDGLVQRAQGFFFKNGAAYEPACEPGNTCTTDMLSFKGYIHRWYANAVQMAPYLAETINPLLESSAKLATQQCTGGTYARQCGFDWSAGAYAANPGTGAGQEMSVLAAAISLLATPDNGAITAKTGGTSQGDPNAGQNPNSYKASNVTTAGKVGAGFITAVLIVLGLGIFGWMTVDG
ncbi:hypothetical protein VHEMI05865 [[Torrubiella] hemipterigena]|nr:hypothetical protein VHEMI05865 [[Torrubiella] hemipterigena]